MFSLQPTTGSANVQQTQEGTELRCTIAREKKEYVIIPGGEDLSEGHGMAVLRYSARAMCHPIKQANAGVSPFCSYDRHHLGYPCHSIEALSNSCSGLFRSEISAPWCVGPRQPSVWHFPVPRHLAQVTDSKTVHATSSRSSLAFWTLPHVPLLNSIWSPMLTVCLGQFGELNCYPHFTKMCRTYVYTDELTKTQRKVK